MKKISLATLTLLLCAVWAMAQSYPSQTSHSAGAAKTVQGCLSQSNGNYVLTDKSGTAYQLGGDTSQLSAHVGHEIQIKGTMAEAGAASAGAAGAQPKLDVTSMKHISETCSSTPKSEKDNMPEKPPTARK